MVIPPPIDPPGRPNPKGTYQLFSRLRWQEMFTFHLSKSVKDLLGPTYQHVNTWGGVNECMQKEVTNKVLATSQHTATMVLQNLHEFHDKNEARKASIQ